MTTQHPVDALVARSGAWKEELLEFARAPRFDQEFRHAVRTRFDGPMMIGDESDIENLFDWFLQLLGWRNVRELLHTYKKAWLTRPALPGVSIINDRLRPYVT